MTHAGSSFRVSRALNEPRARDAPLCLVWPFLTCTATRVTSLFTLLGQQDHRPTATTASRPTVFIALRPLLGIQTP
jgi:hypothetical protein